MSGISIIGLGNMVSALADRALVSGNAVEISGSCQWRGHWRTSAC